MQPKLETFGLEGVFLPPGSISELDSRGGWFIAGSGSIKTARLAVPTNRGITAKKIYCFIWNNAINGANILKGKLQLWNGYNQVASFPVASQNSTPGYVALSQSVPFVNCMSYISGGNWPGCAAQVFTQGNLQPYPLAGNIIGAELLGVAVPSFQTGQLTYTQALTFYCSPLKINAECETVTLDLTDQDAGAFAFCYLGVISSKENLT